MSNQVITPAEVATHNTPEAGLYVIIDGGVYDVTSEQTPASRLRYTQANYLKTEFVDEHPGG